MVRQESVSAVRRMRRESSHHTAQWDRALFLDDVPGNAGDGSASSTGHGGLSLRNFVDRLSELNVVCPVLAFAIGSIDPAISIYLNHTMLNGKFTLRRVSVRRKPQRATSSVRGI